MKDLLLTLLHLAVMTAKLCGPGGVRAVIAENLLLKQQLIVLRRARQRAPNLTLSDRLLCGFGSLFLSPGRIRKVAIGVRPSTLLAFHQALVRRKYHRLFSSSPCSKKRGPKGPGEALIRHRCASTISATLRPRSCFAQGVHPRVVMKTLGHSQISLTLDTYSHVLPGLQAEAASRMDEALGANGRQIGSQNEKGSAEEPQESQESGTNVVSRGGIEPPTRRLRV